MNIADIWKYDLRKGNTDHPRNGACLFDAAMWLVYGRIGDNPPCSCPVIREYAIGLNDLMPDELRATLLSPFILRVVGNRDLPAAEMRLHRIVLETARRVVPLTAPTRPEFMALTSLPDDASFETIMEVARKASTKTPTSYASTYASTYTANAAAHAGRGDIRHALHLAIHAVRCAAETVIVGSLSAWTTATQILDAALRIGRQSPEFDEAQVRESVRTFGIAAGLEEVA